MPLEEIVESLEGIDASYHDLYVKGEDGKFKIDVSGMKSALTKERNLRKQLEKKVKPVDDPPDIEELKLQLEKANDTIKSININSKVKSVAITSGIDVDYVDDVITLTRSNFKLNETGEVIHVGADGEPTGKSVDSFFKEDFKKSKPRFYTSTGRQGSGGQPNLNGDGPLSPNGTINKAIEKKDVRSLVQLKQQKINKK